ncbi:MAG: metallophosphoesterase family protein [Chitinivibrionales bacterium]|nr:metallophosphoesterase family protein [Chitinivibrionales bacterium]
MKSFEDSSVTTTNNQYGSKQALIGIIADTHGQLRDEVVEKLKPCDLIIHAGDIGSMTVLETLRTMCQCVAVAGNIDQGLWSLEVPQTERVNHHDVTMYVIHDIANLDFDPSAASINIVVYGHSHQQTIFYKDNVMFINPGSAGPRRFNLPVSMAYCTIHNGKIKPQLISL